MIGNFTDIETIPCQKPGYLEELIEKEKQSLKAPSDMTKTKALEDLKITDAAEIKSLSKDDAIAMWVEKFAEELSRGEAERKFRNTSFDPTLGEVLSIAWACGDGEIKAVSRKEMDEVQMLATFFLELAKESKSDYFIGHHIRFDLEFLWKRAVILGLNPGIALKWQGRHGIAFFCTMEAWAGFNKRISQDALCEILGLEKKPDDIDGSKVYDYYLAGEIDKIVEYNKHDVKTVRDIYKRVSV